MLGIDIIALEPITPFSDLRDTDFYKANLNTECVQKLCGYTQKDSLLLTDPLLLSSISWQILGH